MTRFSDDEKRFWADLLLYVEQEVKPGGRKGFEIKNKQLTTFRRQNGITLKWKPDSSDLNKPADSLNKNTILFKSHNNVCGDLLCHLRNAFAHCRIEKEQDGTYLLYDKHNGSTNMVGRIRQNLLPELVEQIKAIRH